MMEQREWEQKIVHYIWFYKTRASPKMAIHNLNVINKIYFPPQAIDILSLGLLALKGGERERESFLVCAGQITHYM